MDTSRLRGQKLIDARGFQQKFPPRSATEGTAKEQADGSVASCWSVSCFSCQTFAQAEAEPRKRKKKMQAKELQSEVSEVKLRKSPKKVRSTAIPLSGSPIPGFNESFDMLRFAASS